MLFHSQEHQTAVISNTDEHKECFCRNKDKKVIPFTKVEGILFLSIKFYIIV